MKKQLAASLLLAMFFACSSPEKGIAPTALDEQAPKSEREVTTGDVVNVTTYTGLCDAVNDTSIHTIYLVQDIVFQNDNLSIVIDRAGDEPLVIYGRVVIPDDGGFGTASSESTKQLKNTESNAPGATETAVIRYRTANLSFVQGRVNAVQKIDMPFFTVESGNITLRNLNFYGYSTDMLLSGDTVLAVPVGVKFRYAGTDGNLVTNCSFRYFRVGLHILNGAEVEINHTAFKNNGLLSGQDNTEFAYGIQVENYPGYNQAYSYATIDYCTFDYCKCAISSNGRAYGYSVTNSTFYETNSRAIDSHNPIESYNAIDVLLQSDRTTYESNNYASYEMLAENNTIYASVITPALAPVVVKGTPKISFVVRNNVFKNINHYGMAITESNHAVQYSSSTIDNPSYPWFGDIGGNVVFTDNSYEGTFPAEPTVGWFIHYSSSNRKQWEWVGYEAQTIVNHVGIPQTADFNQDGRDDVFITDGSVSQVVFSGVARTGTWDLDGDGYAELMDDRAKICPHVVEEYQSRIHRTVFDYSGDVNLWRGWQDESDYRSQILIPEEYQNEYSLIAGGSGVIYSNAPYGVKKGIFFDADGKEDIMILSSNGIWFFYDDGRYMGDSNINPMDEIVINGVVFPVTNPDELRIAKLKGVGDENLAEVLVGFYNGSGSGKWYYSEDGHGPWTFWKWKGAGEGSSKVRFGNFDGEDDWDDELFFWDGDVCFRTDDGVEGRLAPDNIGGIPVEMNNMAIGDFDGDGIDDLITIVP